MLRSIDEHLDDDLNGEVLSAVAACSKHHFHRQFTAPFGIGVHRYVQPRRLKRAGYKLACRSGSSVTDIAFESGYGGPEAFCRAFRARLGQSPSALRKQPAWQSWRAIYRPIIETRLMHMQHNNPAEAVRVVAFQPTRVAVLEHRGDTALIGDSVRKFIAWRKQAGLPPRVSATFNIFYDDPATTPPERFRLDLCAATVLDVAGEGIVTKVIPGGRCAVLRVCGADEALRDALALLYREWLPHSGEAPGDFPRFVQRVRFFPDVPEHAAVTEIYLPLR